MARKSLSTGNDHGLINVMAVRFSALGDVAMTVPVIYSACRCYPDVRFIFVTRPVMTGIFINPPSNLTLVGADVKHEYTGISGIHRLTKRLIKDYDIDAFIDLHDVLRTRMMGLFCRLNGIMVRRLNKGRLNKRALTRRHNKVMLPLISSMARYREAFFKAGLPLHEQFDGLYGKNGKGDENLFKVITPGRKQGQKWVGIAPFAAHSGKIYPVEQMETVIKRLCERGDCRIFLFGGGGNEKVIADGWEEKYPGIISLAGKKYGFPVELSLVSHLDVMLTMDSANMHMASIVGTRTISVWGATHPYCGFKGWRQQESDMVQLPITCRPCSVFGNKPCYRGDMLCMKAIRPETIYNKLSGILDNNQ